MNIKDFLEELEKNGIKPTEEDFEIEYFLLKKPSLKNQNKKIKLTPVSFGFKGQENFENDYFYIESLYPHHSLDKDLNGKILYIRKIKPLKNIHFLKYIKPSLVLTNSEIRKPVYSPQFPIFYLPSFLKEKKVKITFKIKKQKRKLKNIYFDIGRGAYTAYINLPYDSFFNNSDEIGIYSSFQLLKDLVKKFLTVKYPRGYKIRVLLTDGRYADYAGLKFHLKNVDLDSILSILNIENTGLGNEKLILKNRRNILDSFHYRKIRKVSGTGNYNVEEDQLEDYSSIDDIKLPIIWFASQPNDNIYRLKKDFLNRNLILNQVNYLFYLLNNIYKGSQ